MRVLITGGAGYLGTELVRKLSHESNIEQIIVYDNLSRGCYALFLGKALGPYGKVELVKADILDSRSLKKAMQGAHVVYHLAAYVSTPHAHLDSHVYEQVNHWGTAEVVSAFEASDAERLIYVSSTSVYGDCNEPASVITRPNPRTSYCQSKLRGEQQVARLMGFRRAITVRLANLYGYSDAMRFDAVINKFAFQGRFEGHLCLHGTGKQVRAFAQVGAAVGVLAQLAVNDTPSNTYNLGFANYSILELLDGFKSVMPELEFSFVDQHFDLHSFSLELNLALAEYCELPKTRGINAEITSLIDQFAV